MFDKKTAAIEKIKKLLRLAQSSNEHEAALAASRAQELLSRYNLDESDYSERELPKEAGESATPTVKKPASWVFALASSVAGAFDCQYFHSSSGRVVFVGVDVDHEVANFTFGYLYRTINKLAATFMSKSRQKKLTLKGQRTARRSYCLGATQVIKLKLAQQKAFTPVTTTALVPVKHALICRKMEAYGVTTKDLDEESVSDRAYWTGHRDGTLIDHGRRAMPSKKTRQLKLAFRG